MSTRGAKLLSLILAGACAVLFLFALTLQFGLGRGYTWLEQDGEVGVVSTSSIDRTPFKLAPESAFVATQARPLFNEDRKPSPDEPDEPVQQASAPLNIALTGVVLTPNVRLAMIQDKVKNNSVALKEGMPMPGDQGGWTLTRINPRSAIFHEQTSGEEVEVELTTAVANPKANVPSRPSTAAAPAPAVPPHVAPNVPSAPTPPASLPLPAGQSTAANPQQEALQRRIEERRKQMREEAERMKQQNMSPEQMREEMQRLQQTQPHP
jgi:general secretion pathway protein N